MFGLKEIDLQALQNIKKQFNIKKLVIFGSRAKGNYKNGSDVDIAIFDNLTYKDFLQISAFLNNEILSPLSYDVLLFNDLINESLKAEIVNFGKEI